MNTSPKLHEKIEREKPRTPDPDFDMADKCDQINSKLYPYVSQTPPNFMPVISQPEEKCSTGKIHSFHFIELTFKKTMFYLAKAITSHPKLFMIIPFIMSLSCIFYSIYSYHEIILETPFRYLYSSPDPSTTVNEHSLKSKLYSKHNFNGVNTEFDRINLMSSYECSLIFSTNRYENTTQEIYKELIRRLSNFSYGSERNAAYTWKDICRETCNNTLVQKHLLNKQHLFQSYSSSIFNLNSTELIIPDVTIEEVYHDTIFSVINFKLKENLFNDIYNNFQSYLKEMIYSIAKHVKTFNSELFFWSFQSYEQDFIKAFWEIHMVLPFTILVLVFICVFISFRFDSYKSKPIFGFYMSIVLMISIFVGYSIQILSSNAVDLMVFPTIFIVCSIGILVMHSLECASARYSMAAVHPADKMAFILSWDGPFFNNSLLIIIGTSVALGILTTNSYLQSIFFLLATCLTTILLFTLLFLTACLYRYEKRESQGIKWYQCFIRGDHAFSNKCVSTFDEASAEVLHEKLTDTHPIMASSLAKLTSCKKSKKYYIFMMTLILVFAIYGCFNIRISISGSNFTKANSNTTKYINKLAQIYDEDFIEIIFEEPIDYYDHYRRKEVLDLLNNQIDEGYISDVISWLNDFESFERNTVYEINSETFVPVINYIFLNTDPFKKYQHDLILDKLYSQVLRSRMYMKLSPKGKINSNQLIANIIQKAKDIGIEITVKTAFKFSIQHDLQTISTFVWAYFLINSIISISSMVLFSNSSMPIIIIIANTYMTTCVLGYAVYFNIPSNIFTMAIVLLGNFLMTTISTSFVYNFSNSGAKNNTVFLKIQYAFQASMRPTLCSCITLILLNLPLLMIDSAPAFVFHLFQITTLIAVFAFMTFLFVAPICLMFLTTMINCGSRSIEKICEESGCCQVEKPVHCVYILPPPKPSFDAIEAHMNLGTHRSTKPLIQPSAPRMIMAPTSPLPNSPILKSRDFLKDRQVYQPHRCLIDPDSSQFSRRKNRPNRVYPYFGDEQIYDEPKSPVISCPYHSVFPINDRLNYNNSSTLPRKTDAFSNSLTRRHPSNAEATYKLRSNIRQNILDNNDERQC